MANRNFDVTFHRNAEQFCASWLERRGLTPAHPLPTDLLIRMSQDYAAFCDQLEQEQAGAALCPPPRDVIHRRPIPVN